MNNYSNNIKHTRKVEIPVPNTKFIIIGKKQENNTWDVFLNDPQNNKTEKIQSGINDNVFKLHCKLILNAEIK